SPLRAGRDTGAYSGLLASEVSVSLASSITFDLFGVGPDERVAANLFAVLGDRPAREIVIISRRYSGKSPRCAANHKPNHNARYEFVHDCSPTADCVVYLCAFL